MISNGCTIDAKGDWEDVPDLLRAGKALPAAWEGLFGPLREACAVGQIGQSLDGRIAARPGQQTCINGPEGIAHLHRLRAVVDAVVVGAGTVRADAPLLTVRHVAGPSPVRVVIDPRGTLPATARAFAADGVHRIVITRQSVQAASADVETIALPDCDGLIAPGAILDALRARGLRRILVEGGAQTMSLFLSSGCLDRLHVVVAPKILGTGLVGINLPGADGLDVPTQIHSLGGEVLFDCNLSAGGPAAR